MWGILYPPKGHRGALEGHHASGWVHRVYWIYPQNVVLENTCTRNSSRTFSIRDFPNNTRIWVYPQGLSPTHALVRSSQRCPTGAYRGPKGPPWAPCGTMGCTERAHVRCEHLARMVVHDSSKPLESWTHLGAGMVDTCMPGSVHVHIPSTSGTT